MAPDSYWEIRAADAIGSEVTPSGADVARTVIAVNVTDPQSE